MRTQKQDQSLYILLIYASGNIWCSQGNHNFYSYKSFPTISSFPWNYNLHVTASLRHFYHTVFPHLSPLSHNSFHIYNLLCLWGWIRSQTTERHIKTRFCYQLTPYYYCPTDGLLSQLWVSANDIAQISRGAYKVQSVNIRPIRAIDLWTFTFLIL